MEKTSQCDYYILNFDFFFLKKRRFLFLFFGNIVLENVLMIVRWIKSDHLGEYFELVIHKWG